MRITRSRYESARKKLVKMTAYQKIKDDWEDAMKDLGDVGDQRVVAIELTKDGTIKAEFETRKDRELAPSESIACEVDDASNRAEVENRAEQTDERTSVSSSI